MKVFKYLNGSRSIADMYHIYDVVYNLKPYAVSKYKSWWGDALEEAYFHILENYDSSKGDLEHYAIKVVGTIYLNKNRREFSSDDKTLITLDEKEIEEYTRPVVKDNTKSDDLKECIKEMIPYFVKDFRFFLSNNTKDRKLNYRELLSKYAYDTFDASRNYLLDNYTCTVSKLIDYTNSTILKNYPSDRYKVCLDKGLYYEGDINDIRIIRRYKGSHSKIIYRIPLDKLIHSVMNLFYSDGGCGKVVIEGIAVYLSLSGVVVCSGNVIKDYIEKDIIGCILSRTNLKVVTYTKGSEILFSSTRDDQNEIVINVFGKELHIELDRMVCKEVV